MDRNDPAEPNAFTDGLEAELLQELESSFGAPREARPAPRAVPREVPIAPRPRAVVPPPPMRPVEDERDPDDLLRSIEEQLGQFERRQAERFAATTASLTAPREPEPPKDLDWNARVEPVEEVPLKREPAVEEAPRDEWPGRRVSRLRPLDDDDEVPIAAPKRAAPVPQTSRAEYRFRGPAGAGWDRTPEEDAAESTAPAEAFRPSEEHRHPEKLPEFGVEEVSEADLFAPAGKTSRSRDVDLFGEDESVREPAEEPKMASEAFRRRRRNSSFPEFDEAPAAESAGGDTGRLAGAFEPDYPAQWQPGASARADEPKITTAQPAARRAIPPRNHAAAQRGGARTVLLTIGAIVVVAVIGGAGALFLRSTERAPTAAPPVIAADQGPVKVEAPPPQAATDAQTAGEAVYNRVAGDTSASSGAGTNEQVVNNAEEPREVARIVLPAPQSTSDNSVVRPVGGDDAASAGSAPASADTTSAASSSPTDEIGPRRVPTYTVRPDGSIVATPGSAQTTGSSQQPSAAQPSAEQQMAAAETEAPADNAGAASNVPTADEALSGAMTPRSTIQDQPAEVAAAPTPRTNAAPSTNRNAPVNLLNDASAPATATPAPAAGATAGYFVQVSSQRTADQAQSAYTDLQRRYGSVLGKLSADIQKADLGTKGIYYRARVGPWGSRAEAIQVCESLKAAGGSCIVTQ